MTKSTPAVMLFVSFTAAGEGFSGRGDDVYSQRSALRGGSSAARYCPSGSWAEVLVFLLKVAVFGPIVRIARINGAVGHIIEWRTRINLQRVDSYKVRNCAAAIRYCSMSHRQHRRTGSVPA